ncbi:phosphonate C-P lyase system protein PhnL [Thioalbus denitrificans]|uniref:Methylphosphonate degradation complex subunit PhnL n=1 Tax=Thioalbus denitrificans TaxID=547122 RepID=A0A369CBR7_9GAMM|nr:phosphonate C-P lyase system protein PhnL [Thioalbus denitrificans]RCX30585.1 methylphosphonate degradation complex subunit PhnL [Thioalbus denitrificans]
MNDVMIRVENLGKTFTLHNQGGVSMEVLRGVEFEVRAGECLVLNGPSGAGKSTLLRSLYANYRLQRGRVWIRHRGALLDLAGAEPRKVIEVRRETIGYVSQFLRAVPRVPALDVVAEPLRLQGETAAVARRKAATLLERLNISPRLMELAPSTFSGGEQQRVNIARGFLPGYPVLLLDEPTASLDAANRAVVIGLIEEARANGAAVVGIFHDAEVRDAVAGTVLDMVGAATESAA